MIKDSWFTGTEDEGGNLLFDKIADHLLDEDLGPYQPSRDPYERAGLPAVAIEWDQTWIKFGNCTGVNSVELVVDFYDGTKNGIAKAKAVCAGCPVTSRCLDYALGTGQKWGVWGGLDEDERRILTRP